MAFIEVNDVTKSYDENRILALRGATLQIEEGEFIAIMGPSGCGKSTLMNMLGGLDVPDEGTIFVGGKNLQEFNDLSEYRSEKVGFIFQLHNLIPTLTASENVQMPMFETRLRGGERSKKAEDLLESVGLQGRSDHIPSKLSGGERQRVAIARALANDPHIIIADEPTGALDSKSSNEVLSVLKKLHTEQKNTIVMVTHELHVAEEADRIVHMLDGKIQN